MSALTAPRNTVQWGTGPVIGYWELPVKAGAVIFEGAIVCVDSSGFCVPGSTALGLIALGSSVSSNVVSNATGANGDVTVRVLPGTLSYSNGSSAVLSTTPLGTALYIVDDQTVALNDANGTRSFAGVFAGLDTTSQSAPGVFVTMDYFLGRAGQSDAISDPGTGVAIPVTRSGSIAIVTAAAETNTLPNPTFVGQQLNLIMSVRAVGDRVITAASAINQAGNTIMTFGAAADMIVLRAMLVAGSLVWRVIANDGVALS